MHSFRNDYSEGAHPRILQALADANLTQTVGYGADPFCRQAADTIRALCRAPGAEVHFFVGGTQVNLITIGCVLRPWEAAIAADTGHIAVHEAGAVETTGHKVCTVPHVEGKVTPAAVETLLAGHDGSEHMVAPRLLYLSQSTELGAVYTKAELEALRAVCDKHGLFLFVDGARLGSAMAAEPSVGFEELAALTDAFTIGGTKNGALFGEALVLKAPLPGLRHYMKQHGAILAKGRLLGLQFQTLLKDGLYLDLARHANAVANILYQGLADLDIPFYVSSPTNQLFPLLPPETARRMADLGYAFEIQPQPDETKVCTRLVTSWATPEEDAWDYLRDLKESL